MSSLRVAAVQLCAVVGSVERNLARAEALARQALAQGARWVILPEFFPSAVAFHPHMLDAWQPHDGAPFQLMARLAREHGAVVGGSFIAECDGDTRNRFLLVFPDGSHWHHDKDIPTMWENCYYQGGGDDGVLDTPRGRVGVAMCWEMIRSQTARRLAGRIDLLVGGSCWWDLRLPIRPQDQAEHAANRALLREAPAQLARRLRVPVVHASHAGVFEGLTPGREDVPYHSRYLGETQIVDGEGRVLGRMSYEEGDGVVVADIVPGRVAGPAEALPEGFWSAPMSPGALKAWELLAEHGRQYYASTFRPRLARPPLKP